MRLRPYRTAFILMSLTMLRSAAAGAQGQRYPVKEWKWSSGDDAARALPEFDDSSWQSLSLPGTVKPGKPGTIFWLRTSFEAPAGAPGRLWFLTDKGGVALELYVNGEYAGSRGSLPPRFDLRATHAAAILLPSAATNGGEKVVLALRCAYKGSSASIPAYSVGDRAAQEFELGRPISGTEGSTRYSRPSASSSAYSPSLSSYSRGQKSRTCISRWRSSSAPST